MHSCLLWWQLLEALEPQEETTLDHVAAISGNFADIFWCPIMTWPSFPRSISHPISFPRSESSTASLVSCCQQYCDAFWNFSFCKMCNTTNTTIQNLWIQSYLCPLFPLFDTTPRPCGAIWASSRSKWLFLAFQLCQWKCEDNKKSTDYALKKQEITWHNWSCRVSTSCHQVPWYL